MYFRQPRYWDSFQCIGGACVDNCCARPWRIDWVKEEIDKVKDAPNCPEEIKLFMENGFKHHPLPGAEDNFVMILDGKPGCPMLTEDKFCRIQREMGVEYLSYTCLSYPRSYFFTISTAYRYCHMSCPEVMKKLLNDDKCMDLVNAKIKGQQTVRGGGIFDTPENVAKDPERKYATEIKEFFYEIISNKKLPLNTCIILGALAAQSLTKLVSIGDYGKIPEAIKTLRSQMHNPEQLKSIENIKTNYNVKLGVTDKLIREFFTSTIIDSFIDKEGKPNIDIYVLSELLLAEEFQNNPFAWRNMALNLMLELSVPFKLEDNTIFENYSIFVLTYAFLRHNALSVVKTNARLGKDYPINVQATIANFNATLSRSLCHSPENLKKLLQRMQDFNMTSPAYLALLVK